MSDEIKVGDRVKWGNIDIRATVLALAGKWAWILQDNYPSDDGYTSARLDTLTRIEPEPVTVTVKYPPGTRVRLRQEHDHVFMVDRVEILYRDPADNSHSWYEDSLEPCDCAKCSSE
jgi:hypothetical protein